jgi:hypothetical protein
MSNVHEPRESEFINPGEAADYIFQLTHELAEMAERSGLSKLAAALELARGLAAESMALPAPQSELGKAAPEEAM